MSEVRFDASRAEHESLRRQSPWWGIHAARYQFAMQHVGGARVLDIACGTGYGLTVLQTRARQVVGADVDMGAARKARAAIGNGPEAVVVADGCRLAFGDATFDVITSFETLEHLELRSQFLAELRRVLTPDGLCIISTPNANYTLPINGKPRNPHHLYEYTPEELVAELRKHFDSSVLLGQVIDSRFRISPFWDDQQQLARTAKVKARLLLWRVLNKLPASLRDRLSYALWGHPLFPGEGDYQFSEATVKTAPVLVAICQRAASA
ncbi:MAG: class I SAM-dependent methyltransferase [Pyrinomonadaceae bacterium]